MRALSDQAAARSSVAAPAVARDSARRRPPLGEPTIPHCAIEPEAPRVPTPGTVRKVQGGDDQAAVPRLGGTQGDWTYDLSRGFVAVSEQGVGADASNGEINGLTLAPSAAGSVGAAASPLSPESQELVARVKLSIQRSKNDREARTLGAAAMPARSARGSNESNDPRGVWEVPGARRVSDATCAAADSLAAVTKRHPMFNDLTPKRLVFFILRGTGPVASIFVPAALRHPPRGEPVAPEK